MDTKHGDISALARECGLPVSTMHSYFQGVNRPRVKRAEYLEKCTGIAFEIWMRGTPMDLRAALSTIKEPS